jgi:hypothetical protein
MKATIEKNNNKEFFNKILYVITSSENEDILRSQMNKIFTLFIDSSDFDFGFGNNQMWVSDIQTKERLITVLLNNN